VAPPPGSVAPSDLGGLLGAPPAPAPAPVAEPERHAADGLPAAPAPAEPGPLPTAPGNIPEQDYQQGPGVLAPTYEVPGVDAYKLPPNPEGGATSPYSANVYLPGHVVPPSAGPLPEASPENGLLSAWHPNIKGQTMSIPVKEAPTYEPTYRGGNIKAPGKLGSIDVSVNQSYQIRAVGMEPVESQQMVTPDGRPVTRVNYEYQYEVRKRTVGTVQGIHGWGESDWKRVSADEVANLVRSDSVAAANVPGREGT
jgi:hypothetical protein